MIYFCVSVSQTCHNLLSLSEKLVSIIFGYFYQALMQHAGYYKTDQGSSALYTETNVLSNTGREEENIYIFFNQ